MSKSMFVAAMMLIFAAGGAVAVGEDRSDADAKAQATVSPTKSYFYFRGGYIPGANKVILSVENLAPVGTLDVLLLDTVWQLPSGCCGEGQDER